MATTSIEINEINDKFFIEDSDVSRAILFFQVLLAKSSKPLPEIV